MSPTAFLYIHIHVIPNCTLYGIFTSCLCYEINVCDVEKAGSLTVTSLSTSLFHWSQSWTLQEQLLVNVFCWRGNSLTRFPIKAKCSQNHYSQQELPNSDCVISYFDAGGERGPFVWIRPSTWKKWERGSWRDMTASLVMWGRQRWGKKTTNAKTCRLFLQICKKYIIVEAKACWDEINQLVWPLHWCRIQ